MAQSSIARFLGGHANFDSLYRWSVERPDEFWQAVWRFCGIKASRMWDETMTPCEGVRRVKWFEGSRLNFAENLLRFQDDEPAIIAWNEHEQRQTITHRELHWRVSRIAQALRAAGLRPGDRVAAYLPNIPETVAAMLATASIGAIWSSCSPDFGVQGVLDRFSQIEPRILIAADGYHYNGKPIDLLPRVAAIRAGLPSVKQTILVTLENAKPDLSSIPNALRWQDALLLHQPGPIQFEPLPFEHPLYILYSSGTTGLPKCMVHGAGGTLLQHLKELVLHTDVKPTDRIFYHTTCGWMMWNWLVSALATGACIVLYDGSPLHPRKDILWEMASKERVSVFGTSAKYLSMLEKEGVAPRAAWDLRRLRTVLSTGSPLLPESFDFVYRGIHPDVQLSSISGGTDIVSCFALGNPIGPVRRGELQVRGLGMDVRVLDERGCEVKGEKGELVCRPPFPSMPLGFWNDPDGSKYQTAYFDKYPGYWRHGDWAELTEHGGLVIAGRSDTTLNPGGVRIGTAEIYRQVEAIPEVVESLVIGQPHGGDVRVVLFVRLRSGVELTPELEVSIRRRIRENASPHHVPKRIVPVQDLPRTVSGKISEMAVLHRIQGLPVKNAGALANPEALEQFGRLDD
jgi:acetoacetyl-CoA synthetase